MITPENFTKKRVGDITYIFPNTNLMLKAMEEAEAFPRMEDKKYLTYSVVAFNHKTNRFVKDMWFGNPDVPNVLLSFIDGEKP